MSAHITDKQKKKIIADYIELGSYNAVAKKWKISATTVKNTVLKDQQIVEKCKLKKEENTIDILSHMESQKDKVCDLLDRYLEAICDKEKIKHANVLQLATTMGIIIDKYTATARNDQALKKLDEMLDKIGGVI